MRACAVHLENHSGRSPRFVIVYICILKSVYCFRGDARRPELQRKAEKCWRTLFRVHLKIKTKLHHMRAVSSPLIVGWHAGPRTVRASKGRWAGRLHLQYAIRVEHSN